MSIKDLAEIVIQASGVEGISVVLSGENRSTGHAGSQELSYLSNQKLARLGWSHTVSEMDGFTRTIASFTE